MKLGTETASVHNWMMSGVSPIKPEVGMGATILMWTDRHAGTIIKVTPTQIHVQEDEFIRVDGNGMSEDQTYQYTANPQGAIHIFRKTKRGYRSGSIGLLIGHREHYHDYSF